MIKHVQMEIWLAGCCNKSCVNVIQGSSLFSDPVKFITQQWEDTHRQTYAYTHTAGRSTPSMQTFPLKQQLPAARFILILERFYTCPIMFMHIWVDYMSFNVRLLLANFLFPCNPEWWWGWAWSTARTDQLNFWLQISLDVVLGEDERREQRGKGS